VRTGGPIDEEEDLAGDAWAGVVPVQVAFGAPTPADDLPAAHRAPPPSVVARATS
jgi:hypothetical protein